MPLPTEVVVHPLVLLSAVDHYSRVAKDTRKRVVGVLLGSTFKGKCDVTNSFAVPFEEDLRNPTVWYLDHSFLEKMERMYRKINGASAAFAARSARLPPPPAMLHVAAQRRGRAARTYACASAD